MTTASTNYTPDRKIVRLMLKAQETFEYYYYTAFVFHSFLYVHQAGQQEIY